MVHILKTVEPYFDLVRTGKKPFEVRQNDRDYAEGDILFLCEFDRLRDSFTGHYVEAKVTYVYKNDVDIHGLQEGYVVLGIELIKADVMPALDLSYGITLGVMQQCCELVNKQGY